MAICAIHFCSPFPVEANGHGLDVVAEAVFGSYVSVAEQRYVVIVRFHYTVEHIFAFCYIGQYYISLFYGVGRSEHSFVASVFEEWTHTVSPQWYCHRVPFIYYAYDFRQEDVIGYLLYVHFVSVSWHRTAAALSGRQCSVYTGVVSIIVVIVLQILLYISLSHFIEEQAGSNEAKAFVGVSFSMLLFFARSILVMAPTGALMLR